MMMNITIINSSNVNPRTERESTGVPVRDRTGTRPRRLPNRSA
jgi:hypothetical protein